MRAYVLIEAKVGMAGNISRTLRALPAADARVLSVDVVTGPFDVIALVETEDIDELGRTVSESIQTIDGVARTNTCLVIHIWE
ncbi:MAG TPA: Lrp/AsnC ligand binding domain-containing protein [Dehalococcoidia bacterium]|nr:Lrp/AsnC ligand binding domain-containing protein [Dehalococcoidia bacterium]